MPDDLTAGLWLSGLLAKYPHLCAWFIPVTFLLFAHVWWILYLHGQVIRLRKWDIFGLAPWKARPLLDKKEETKP